MGAGQALWLGWIVGGGLPSSSQPLPSPTGTLKAKDFKKRCLQATVTQDNTYGAEDCLYLNIWVPQGKKEGLLTLPPPPAPHRQQESPALPLGGVWGSRAELP